MRAAIYSPYLDTLGGGERYMMSAAQVLAKNGCRVDVESSDKTLKEKLEKRFGINLSKVNFVDSVGRGDGYDICFWLSDGSIPVLYSRKNWLHFQRPFNDVGGRTLFNRMKLFRINKVVVNSSFTKKFIDKEFGVESKVVYPPVDVKEFKPKTKENLIVFVGRFSQLEQAKRQDILVKSFKKFYDSGFRDWQFVLAGGVEVGIDRYVEKLRRLSKGYPIKILESPSFSQIKEYYGKAKIFWSATGFGIDEAKKPEKLEHFGITVVEAMAAGCVPVIYKAGGHKEIISDGKSGFFWESLSSLVKNTTKIISDTKLMSMISKNALKASKIYEYPNFAKNIMNLL